MGSRHACPCFKTNAIRPDVRQFENLTGVNKTVYKIQNGGVKTQAYTRRRPYKHGACKRILLQAP